MCTLHKYIYIYIYTLIITTIIEISLYLCIAPTSISNLQQFGLENQIEVIHVFPSTIAAFRYVYINIYTHTYMYMYMYIYIHIYIYI